MSSSILLRQCSHVLWGSGSSALFTIPWSCSSVSVQAGVIDVPVFSFFMGNIDEGAPNGILTLGGVNQSHYEGELMDQS